MSINSDIIFNDTPSTRFNMEILYFEGDIDNEFLVQEHEYDIYQRRDGKVKIINIKRKNTREFEITLVRQTPVEPYEIDAIYKWLMPFDNKYKKLYINEEKYQGYYYNCKISNITAVEVAGYPYAIKCTVICDSHFMYSNEITKKYLSPTLPLSIVFINDSSEELKPIFRFTCNSANGSITLKNETTDKTLTLTGLVLNETITIDSEEQSILSDKSYLRMNNFNKEYMKIKQGLNKLVLNGDVDNFEFTYQKVKAFGN